MSESLICFECGYPLKRCLCTVEDDLLSVNGYLQKHMRVGLMSAVNEAIGKALAGEET